MVVFSKICDFLPFTRFPSIFSHQPWLHPSVTLEKCFLSLWRRVKLPPMRKNMFQARSISLLEWGISQCLSPCYRIAHSLAAVDSDWTLRPVHCSQGGNPKFLTKISHSLPYFFQHILVIYEIQPRLRPSQANSSACSWSPLPLQDTWTLGAFLET